MQRSTFPVVAAVFCLLVALSKPALAREVALRFIDFQSSARRQACEQLLKDFQTRNPGITVTYEVSQIEKSIRDAMTRYPDVRFPDEIVRALYSRFQEELMSALAAGTAQDVFPVSTAWARTAMKRDHLLSLDRYMKRGVTRGGDFLPTLIEGLSYKGQVYGIPTEFDTLVLFYNKEMFDAARLAYPNPNWTWEDLRSAARKLTKPSMTPAENQYGINLQPDVGTLIAFVFQAGGKLLNEKDEPILPVQSAITAFDFYTGFWLKDKSAVPLTFSDVYKWSADDSFAGRRAAMSIEWSRTGRLLRANAPGLIFGVTELPRGPAGRGNVYSASAYSINKQTRNADEAWKLVEFLTSAENQLKNVEAGSLPSRVALKEFENLERRSEIATVFNTLTYAKQLHLGEHFPDVEKTIWESVWGVMRGWVTVKDAAEQATRDLARIGR